MLVLACGLSGERVEVVIASVAATASLAPEATPRARRLGMRFTDFAIDEGDDSR